MIHMLNAFIWYEYLLDLAGKIIIPLIIGYVTYIISRKQIANSGVTQFRQKWIDSLRDAISLFIAKAEVIATLDYEDEETYVEHFFELSQMQGKIELYLNPNEDDHIEIIALMEDIREIIHEENWTDKVEDKLNESIEELLDISRKVLRREWKKVIKGE